MIEQIPAISIAYDCTKAEQREASILLGSPPSPAAVRRARAGRGIFGWVIVLGIIIAIFVVVHDARPQKPNHLIPQTHLPISVVVAMAAFAFGAANLLIGFFLMRILRRRQDRKNQQRVTMRFDSTGMTQHRSGRTDIYYWSFFCGFEEGPGVFVIRTQPTRGYTFPKRLFADDLQRECFRALLREHLAPIIPIASAPEARRP